VDDHHPVGRPDRFLGRGQDFVGHQAAVQHTPVQHTPVQHSAIQHSAIQHSAIQHSAIQHSAIQHSAIQHSAVEHDAAQRWHQWLEQWRPGRQVNPAERRLHRGDQVT